MSPDVRKPTILVADDDAFFRRLLTYQLIKLGCRVLTAHDGREALDWLNDRTSKPDLALLDLLMPQYSGIEVMAVIKTLPYRLPVILMSKAEEHIAREGANGSIPDMFLSKPLSLPELMAGIKSLLPHYELADAMDSE